MSEKKHIMLDFDGTIADTSEGIVRSMHYVYDRIGLERENEETIRSTIGPPLEQMLAILLKTDDKEYIKKCVVLFRERYAEKGIWPADFAEDCLQLPGGGRDPQRV